MEYLHSQSVVRMLLANIDRDIKPGNILLTVDGIVKITDFGIAEVRLKINSNSIYMLAKIYIVILTQALINLLRQR
jgi:serine/threonine protein kinase